MGLYSRNRGKRGERLWCSFCREQGYDVHRTAQYRGNTGAAGDVEGLPFIHVECKYVQYLNIREALAQSERDTKAEGKGNLPIVASKRTREDWLVTMYERDFVTMTSLVDRETLDDLIVIQKTALKFGLRKFLRESSTTASDEWKHVAVKYPRGPIGEKRMFVTMYAEDWFELYREWEAGMDLKAREEP